LAEGNAALTGGNADVAVLKMKHFRDAARFVFLKGNLRN